jgi:hypothetical protein
LVRTKPKSIGKIRRNLLLLFGQSGLQLELSRGARLLIASRLHEQQSYCQYRDESGKQTLSLCLASGERLKYRNAANRHAKDKRPRGKSQ